MRGDSGVCSVVPGASPVNNSALLSLRACEAANVPTLQVLKIAIIGPDEALIEGVVYCFRYSTSDYSPVKMNVDIGQ